MITAASAAQKAELRGLILQFIALAMVVLGIAVLKIMTGTDADRGLMSCIAVIAVSMDVITGLQIATLVRRLRISTDRARIATTRAETPQPTSASAREDEPPTLIRCASTAHVRGDVVSVTSQYREIVEHDARTPALPRAPKGPTMIYCPR